MDSTPDSKLELLTLNCWGLKFLAKHRSDRLPEIGARIASRSPPAHIVGLQECWTQEDYQSIRAQTKSILPYGKFYHSGIFGGGLAILSRWPIEESNMFRYPLNGRPTAFFRGDWFVGKGVACARIRMGPKPDDLAEVFCTHLHAPYEAEPHDSYICHRTAQAWEIAKLMRGAAERGHLVVGLGDFNMVPLSLAHRLITAHGFVLDAWRVLHPDSSLGAAVDQVEKARGLPLPTAAFNVSHNGATCDSVLNSWRWDKSRQKRLDKGEDIVVEATTPDPCAKRLDYIFVGQDAARSRPSPWQIESVAVGFTQRHPKLKCSLSDHFSVEARLTRRTVGPTASRFDPHTDVEQLPSLQPSDTLSFLPVPTYDEILAMIDVYMLRERRQRRLRLAHLILQIFISIGCLVAVWWSARAFVAFLLMLLSTLGLAAGVIDGLIGGLFVGSEIRALKEFRWEIANVRAAAAAKADGKGE